MFYILSALSGLAWTLVYIFIILKSIKDKRCGMPLFALAFNLSWEFVYSILVGPGWNIQRAINLVWLIFDIFIFILYLKYEKEPFEKDYGSRFYRWTGLVFISSFIIMLAAKYEFEGYLGAQYSAYAQNLMMSVLFIQMLFKFKSSRSQSKVIAYSKMIGTLAPTILVFLSKGSYLLQVMGLVIVVFDLLYAYLLSLTIKKEKEGLNGNVR